MALERAWEDAQMRAARSTYSCSRYNLIIENVTHFTLVRNSFAVLLSTNTDTLVRNMRTKHPVLCQPVQPALKKSWI